MNWTHIKLFVKLVDPVNGLVIGRSEVEQTGSVYAYDRKMASWFVFFAAGMNGAGFVVPKDHLLLVEFDVENRVIRYARIEGYTALDPEFPTGGIQ